MEKEGWLMKNDDKRYCYLSNGELRWASKPFAKVKNTLKLQDYNVLTAKGGAQILLSPVDGDGKEYRLVGDNLGDWADAMRSWTDADDGDGDGAAAVASNTSLRHGDESDGNAASSLTASASHSGWLLKKGKKRWFVLERGTLYWAAKEMDRTNDAWKRAVNGSLELSDYTVTIVDPLQFDLISSSGTKYALSATLQSETDRWLAAFRATFQQRGLNRHDERFTSIKDEKRGFLQKKGQRRYVIMRRGSLIWYTSDDESSPKGMLDLGHCSLMVNDQTTFTITTSDFKAYEWTGKNSYDVAEWVARCKASIKQTKTETLKRMKSKEAGSVRLDTFAKQSWVKKKGKGRFLVLRGNTLLWFEKEQGSDKASNCKNSMMLMHCKVWPDKSDTRTFHITKGAMSVDEAEPYSFVCNDSVTCMEWVEVLTAAVQRATKDARELSSGAAELNDAAVLKRGILTKKGKLRLFVLTQRMLAWYEAPDDGSTEVPEGQKVKGHFLLQGCKVEKYDMPAAFVVTLPTGVEYVLVANEQYEAVKWQQLLNKCISKCNSSLEPNRVFGLPLEQLVARQAEQGQLADDGLPTIVHNSVEFLCAENRVQLEGLFRISGDQVEIERWREQYNNGVVAPFDADTSPHNVAGLLKLWLRELPEPLLSDALYQAFVSIDPRDGALVKALVQKLPRASLRVLAALCRLLGAMLDEENRAVNRMTVENLAIVFGPTLLRVSGDDPVAEMRDTPIVLEIAKTLLTCRNDIFPSNAESRDRSFTDKVLDIPSVPRKAAPKRGANVPPIGTGQAASQNGGGGGGESLDSLLDNVENMLLSPRYDNAGDDAGAEAAENLASTTDAAASAPVIYSELPNAPVRPKLAPKKHLEDMLNDIDAM